LVVHCNFLW